jgi:cytochrome c oxidase subunit 3
LAHAVPTAHAKQLASESTNHEPVRNVDGGTQFVGLVMFLGSATVMFAALFFSFATYRVNASSSWPPLALTDVPLWIPTMSTVLIFASSLVLESARRRVFAGDLVAAKRRVMFTFILAVAFVAMQSWLWQVMWAKGVTLSSEQFASYFYLLTVFHALHIVVGLGLLSYLSRRLSGDSPAGVRVPARLITLFWHFVGVVWGLLFVLLFFS